jgi:hypothetical protein
VLAFTRGHELTMMRYTYGFRLVDARGRVREPFGELNSVTPTAVWTPDSRIVAVPVGEDGLLLYDVTRRRYAVLGFNAYSLRVTLTRDTVRIAPDLEQFRLVFGRRFRPPRPNVVALATLRWRPAPRAWKLATALHRAPGFRWQPPPSPALLKYAKKHHVTIHA